MNNSTHFLSKTISALALAGVLLVVASRTENVAAQPVVEMGESVALTYASQDEAQATIKDLLSAGPAVQRAAPATWSCRFDVRWKARWESSQQYLS